MLRSIVVVGSLVFGATVVLAQQELVTQTQALMKANGKNLGGVLSAMAKGDRPYDQAAVDTALVQLDETAKKLPSLFPASVKGLKADGDYSSSPKIWDNRAEFDAKIASFAKVVADAKAKIKDLDSLKAMVPAIGKECGGCHENFRVKNS